MIPIRPGFYGNLRQYVNVKTLIKKEVKKPGQAALATRKFAVFKFQKIPGVDQTPC